MAATLQTLGEGTLRLATDADRERIVEIFEQAKAFMREQGFQQWDEHYPTIENINRDLSEHALYVWEVDGQVVGSAYLSVEPEPIYQTIDGAWHSQGDYAVMHRLAMARNSCGTGAAKAFFTALSLLASEMGACYLRLDTHPQNRRMQHFMKREGCVPCGICYKEDGRPVKAYDRDLSQLKKTSSNRG